MSRTITNRSVRRQVVAALAAAATLTLVTACSSSTASPAAAPAPASSSAIAPSTAATAAPSTAASKPASSVTELKTATTSLGAVVTDGKGMVLYAYMKDTQGTQLGACTGGCATAWPLALADSAPILTGVTGTVTMIPTASGGKQLALNGWPLYYYAKDKAAGDILGQGVGTVWYVLDASGTPKKA